MTKQNPKEELEKANAVAKACRLGQISYEEAKKICEGHLAIVNQSIKELAQKFHQKPHKITFTSLLR